MKRKNVHRLQHYLFGLLDVEGGLEPVPSVPRVPRLVPEIAQGLQQAAPPRLVPPAEAGHQQRPLCPNSERRVQKQVWQPARVPLPTRTQELMVAN